MTAAPPHRPASAASAPDERPVSGDQPGLLRSTGAPPSRRDGSEIRHSAGAGDDIGVGRGEWRTALIASLGWLACGALCVFAWAEWLAGALTESPWRAPVELGCGLVFVAGSATALRHLLRRARVAGIEAAQGALDGSLRYEDLFEHHPTPMWVYDALTQQFLAVNDAALHRYGYSEAEFLGMTLRDIRPAQDVPLFLAHRTNTSRKGYGDAGVWRHRTKAGDLIHMHVSLNRTTYRGRAGTLVMAREVTQEVKSLEALEELKNSLEERVDRRTAELESANLELDAFARSAAHDLRTPLNGILGFTQLLQYELAQASARQLESLDQIDRSAKTMLALIDGLLAMSRVAQKAMVFEQAALSDLAALAIQQLRNAEPARRVACVIQGELAVHGDPTLLFSLLSNLLSNAWKYTSRTTDARIEFGARVLPDRSLVYFVRDNGVGFPMAQAERLFKPFQRLHSIRDFQGHGIGLVTCLRVVQRHGGQIWPVSEVGVGTTIWFTLPAGAGSTI